LGDLAKPSAMRHATGKEIALLSSEMRLELVGEARLHVPDELDASSRQAGAKALRGIERERLRQHQRVVMILGETGESWVSLQAVS
jgi:hypothetical protein